MPIVYPLSFQVTLPSQCDAQKGFLVMAEGGQVGKVQVLSSAVSELTVELNGSLIPGLNRLELLLATNDDSPEAEKLNWKGSYESAMVATAGDIAEAIYAIFAVANSLQLPFDVLFQIVHNHHMSTIKKGEDGNLVTPSEDEMVLLEGYKEVNIKNTLFPKKAPVIEPAAGTESGASALLEKLLKRANEGSSIAGGDGTDTVDHPLH